MERLHVTTSPFLSLNSPVSLPLNCVSPLQMQFMLLFSRQGKLRLQKWYVPLSDKEKKKITRELVQTVLARKPKMCSFLEWRDLKIVYKRSVVQSGYFHHNNMAEFGCFSPEGHKDLMRNHARTVALKFSRTSYLSTLS